MVCKKAGSQSTYSVINTGCLTPSWTLIFIHNFNNNDFLPKFLTDLLYVVWNVKISHSLSQWPACSIRYIPNYVASRSALFESRSWPFPAILGKLLYSIKSKVSLRIFNKISPLVLLFKLWKKIKVWLGFICEN